MDKKEFDIIKGYTTMLRHLHTELTFHLSESEADEMLDPFDSYHSKTLKLGRYLDESQFINRESRISEAYEGLSSYTKLTIIYSYDTGYSLCETTDGDLHLIPSNIIV